MSNIKFGGACAISANGTSTFHRLCACLIRSYTANLCTALFWWGFSQCKWLQWRTFQSCWRWKYGIAGNILVPVWESGKVQRDYEHAGGYAVPGNAQAGAEEVICKLFFKYRTSDNRSARAAFIGIGKCVPNKQTVIFSKMTLLATTSSSTEKEISKQGFRMSKFRIPVDAILSSMAMWWIRGVASPIPCYQQFQKKILQFASNRVAKRSFLYSPRVKGNTNFPSHKQKGGCY